MKPEEALQRWPWREIVKVDMAEMGLEGNRRKHRRELREKEYERHACEEAG